MLAAVRGQPGITRAALARQLHLSSGSAVALMTRLRQADLLTESPAAVTGRGRPTTVLQPHPAGPLVLAIDLRQSGWRCAVATVEGRLHDLRATTHGERHPQAVIAALRGAVDAARSRYGRRLRMVSLAVAGTVRGGKLAQSAALDWGPVDLGSLSDDARLPVLLGNDASLAAVAEARTGAATGSGCALHIVVQVGVGGALTTAGQPFAGASGAGGEYGHMPFGDRSLRCPCGASGCWDLEVDGRALARELGHRPPADPASYAQELLVQRPLQPDVVQAVDKVASALGGGLAGLVNAHDPEVVTLGGLAVTLREAAPAAFDAAYTDGLMRFRRSRPPEVLNAHHGQDGPLRGAAEVGLDAITDEFGLADWHQPIRM